MLEKQFDNAFLSTSDERVPCENFASQLKELNDEQKIIVDDILHKKNKNPTKPLHIF
jgi:hypothetical protein